MPLPLRSRFVSLNASTSMFVIVLHFPSKWIILPFHAKPRAMDCVFVHQVISSRFRMHVNISCSSAAAAAKSPVFLYLRAVLHVQASGTDTSTGRAEPSAQHHPNSPLLPACRHVYKFVPYHDGTHRCCCLALGQLQSLAQVVDVSSEILRHIHANFHRKHHLRQNSKR